LPTCAPLNNRIPSASPGFEYAGGTNQENESKSSRINQKSKTFEMETPPSSPRWRKRRGGSDKEPRGLDVGTHFVNTHRSAVRACFSESAHKVSMPPRLSRANAGIESRKEFGRDAEGEIRRAGADVATVSRRGRMSNETPVAVAVRCRCSQPLSSLRAASVRDSISPCRVRSSFSFFKCGHSQPKTNLCFLGA